MTGVAGRKQARRFWGTMGAATRRTSRWLDARNRAPTDSVIRGADGSRARVAARSSRAGDGRGR